MGMFGVGHEKLQAALRELQQALYNHERWHRDLTRSLICRLACDDRDVAENAHRQCRFGQWYYDDASSELRSHPAFSAIGAEHKRMHQLASALLRTAETNGTVSPDDYDTFANTLDRLRLEINTLQREIEESLYNADPLTGAANRIGTLTKLREQLDLVKRNVQQCCIAIMDLDRFKTINDTYGHRVGDQVLALSVRYVMDHMRPYDKIFRYGGDEFLISMPNTDLRTGHAVINRIREGLGSATLAHDGSTPIATTASFGLALLEPDVGVEESINRADKALYAAKAAGRDRVLAWDSPVSSTE
jgi:diguanylate cyclase (GGDEF)-like protein